MVDRTILPRVCPNLKHTCCSYLLGLNSISTPDANGQTLQTFDGITSSPFTWATNIRAGRDFDRDSPSALTVAFYRYPSWSILD